MIRYNSVGSIGSAVSSDRLTQGGKQMTRNQEAFQKLEALYQDNAIRDRKCYPDFRRGWNALL